MNTRRKDIVYPTFVDAGSIQKFKLMGHLKKKNVVGWVLGFELAPCYRQRGSVAIKARARLSAGLPSSAKEYGFRGKNNNQNHNTENIRVS